MAITFLRRKKSSISNKLCFPGTKAGIFLFLNMKYFFGKPLLFFCALLLQISLTNAQTVRFETLLEDNISIRAIQVDGDKIYYTGTDSKFGYVSVKDPSDKKQIRLSEKELQFRTLAKGKKDFYTVNIESPAWFFRIDPETFRSKLIYTDTLKSAFYDAFHFINEDLAFAFSDTDESLSLKLLKIVPSKNQFQWYANNMKMNEGEAAFAASNTNLDSSKQFLWLGTGGGSARIFKFSLQTGKTEIFETEMIQDSESQGIYSIDFYDENFGIAVGGDYTKQSENINNIATTNDGGKTWQIQASGKNAGYMTCVKFRPKSKGKDIIAVGDQHISISTDYGKTWTKISDEKGLYACEWYDKNTLILAGKNRILKITLHF